MTKHTDSSHSHGLDTFYDALRRPGITRATRGRWFGGVATGLARWLGVDPLVVRAALIFFALFFGMGLTIYLILLLLMPSERGDIFLERALKYGEGAPITLLVVTGIVTLGGGPWFGNDVNGLRIGGYVVIGVLAWWFLTRTDRGRYLMSQKPWMCRPGDQPTSADVPTAAADLGMPRSTGNAAAAAGVALHDPQPQPVAPPQPRVRTKTIGFAGGMLALGLAIVAGAIATAIAGNLALSGNQLALGFAAGLGVLGLALVVAGLAGRRAGWIGGFVWLGIWAAIFTSAVPAGLTQPWQVGERTHTVTSLTGANDFQLGMGDMTVDLTDADYKGTPTVQPDVVRATLGLGELTIVVPADTKVTVHAKGRAGELIATDSHQSSTGAQFDRDGTGWSETLTYGPSTGPDEIVVEAEVGLGQLNVKTGSAS